MKIFKGFVIVGAVFLLSNFVAVNTSHAGRQEQLDRLGHRTADLREGAISFAEAAKRLREAEERRAEEDGWFFGLFSKKKAESAKPVQSPVRPVSAEEKEQEKRIDDLATRVRQIKRGEFSKDPAKRVQELDQEVGNIRVQVRNLLESMPDANSLAEKLKANQESANTFRRAHTGQSFGKDIGYSRSSFVSNAITKVWNFFSGIYQYFTGKSARSAR